MTITTETPDLSTTSLEVPPNSQALQTTPEVLKVPSSEVPVATEIPEATAVSSIIDPDEYEIELSDDSPLSAEDLNEIAEEASARNLSREDANKLIASREASYNKGVEFKSKEYNDRLVKDYNAIISDPMFIGDEKAKTYEAINRAVETFGDSEMVELLRTPEIGNNITLAKFLKKIGDAMAPEIPLHKGISMEHGGKDNDSLKRSYPEFYK